MGGWERDGGRRGKMEGGIEGKEEPQGVRGWMRKVESDLRRVGENETAVGMVCTVRRTLL